MGTQYILDVYLLWNIRLWSKDFEEWRSIFQCATLSTNIYETIQYCHLLNIIDNDQNINVYFM